MSELKVKTNNFLFEYRKTRRSKLSTQPEWKIDSLISDSKKYEVQKLTVSEKIELIIKEDDNPFIELTNKLFSNIEKGQTSAVNNLISNMTNGKFLDSLGIPNQSEKNETLTLIERFTDELWEIKKAGNKA
ncbi:hypothetical protein [Cellulophaga baltica]|uniref:Phage protein n=1 Tax=Cellulophaga baltica 18 TaxID=1348584 RepID=A0AAU8S275_9FLAO|nr:hypothetical protein [Cellulophaga baltica]AIZ43350.1 hypothetical protein M666_18415 [Cellulophaga baltica 18]